MKIKFLLVTMMVAAVVVSATPVYADAVSFSQSTVAVAAGGTNSITISGGTDFYVASNSNPSAASYILSGTSMTISGATQGSAVLSICSVAGSCSSLTINVGASSTSTSSSNSSVTSSSLVSLSTTNPTLAVGQSMNITISGSTSYFISNNSNSAILQAVLNGNVLTVTGLTTGSATLSICGTSGGCSTLSATVTATGVVTPVATPTPMVSSATPASLLATIQSMQTQLAQMLQTIQAMQAQLSQITASLGSAPVTLATPATSVAVTPSVSSGSSNFSSFLSLNSTGSEVTALQQKLTKDGFYSGPISGTFGPLTEAALKKYQSAHSIDPAGYVGPSTRNALNTQ